MAAPEPNATAPTPRQTALAAEVRSDRSHGNRAFEHAPAVDDEAL